MTSQDLYKACQKIVFEAGAILETEKKREYKIIRKRSKYSIRISRKLILLENK